MSAVDSSAVTARERKYRRVERSPAHLEDICAATHIPDQPQTAAHSDAAAVREGRAAASAVPCVISKNPVTATAAAGGAPAASSAARTAAQTGAKNTTKAQTVSIGAADPATARAKSPRVSGGTCGRRDGGQRLLPGEKAQTAAEHTVSAA